MSTLAQAVPTTTPSRFLRRALAVDAVSSAGLGLLLIAGASALEGPLGLAAAQLRAAGIVLLPFAAFVGWTASRARIPRPAAWAVVALNAIWTAESLLLLETGWVQPTSLGTAFVVAQALFVAALALAEQHGLRRSR